MNEYIHLRNRASDVFEMRYQETIDPDKDRWELCSRVRENGRVRSRVARVEHTRLGDEGGGGTVNVTL